MTSPSLPTFGTLSRRYPTRPKRRNRSISLRRKQTLESVALFIFFTVFFAVITVALFS